MKYCNIVTAIIISSHTCTLAVSSYYLLAIYSIVSLQYCTVYRVDSPSIYFSVEVVCFAESVPFQYALQYCASDTAVLYHCCIYILEIAAVHLTCQY